MFVEIRTMHIPVLISALFAVAVLTSTAVHAAECPEPENPNADLIERAVTKLTHAELNALLSTPLAVAEAALDRTESSYGPSKKDVLRHFRETMAELMKPAKFQDAWGNEYDCYGDYMREQWGAHGYPCF